MSINTAPSWKLVLPAMLYVLLGLILMSCNQESNGQQNTLTRSFWDFRSADDLKDWQVKDTNSFAAKVFSTLEVSAEEAGVLRAVADAGTWYNTSSGGLVYQKTKVDFVATARIRVYGAENPVPRGSFEQAGLMLRKSREAGSEDKANWEYVVTGGHGGERIVDFKTTKDSVSHYDIQYVDGPWIELRLARWGSSIVKFWREDGGQWQWLSTEDRPDLVGEMELGICYLANFSGKSDLHADVDWIKIEGIPPAPETPPTDKAGWESFLGVDIL